MTIITWFVSNKRDEEIIDSFQDYFSDFRKFGIRLGEQTIFGSSKRAPVTLVEPDENLLNLHGAALKWFDQIGGRWAVKDPHVDSEYKPHIRRRRGKKLLGDKLA